MKSFKMYKGQELEYDGQRVEWEEDPEETDYMPKSAIKRLHDKQEEYQDEEGPQEAGELAEELTEWEIEERRDNAMGIFILCGFLIIAVTNLMKYGQL